MDGSERSRGHKTRITGDEVKEEGRVKARSGSRGCWAGGAPKG